MRYWMVAPATALLAAFGVTSAGAADILSNPLFNPQPTLVQNWSGVYLGGHVGYAWDHRDASIFSPAGALLATGSTSADSMTGGGQLGFNYALTRQWIVGVEADISGANLHSTSVGASGFGQRDSKIDVFGTVRGRLGYAWDSLLLYGTGGFAWADEEIVRTQQIGTVNGATPGTVEKASAIGTGWAAGGGLEWMFMPNWSLRAEYLHLDIGTKLFSFPLSRQRIEGNARIDIARVGLNYALNWGSR